MSLAGGYWPSGYWPTGYWPRGYWPAVGASTTLLGAINARVAATPALADVLVYQSRGQDLLAFFTGKVPAEAEASMPYGSLREVAETPRFTTAGLSGQATVYQVNFFGTNPDELKAIKKLWQAAFGPKMSPMLVSGQLQMVVWNGTAALLEDPDPDDEGNPVFHQMIEVHALMNGSG